MVDLQDKGDWVSRKLVVGHASERECGLSKEGQEQFIFGIIWRAPPEISTSQHSLWEAFHEYNSSQTMKIS
jgi:hypothetical protein